MEPRDIVAGSAIVLHNNSHGNYHNTLQLETYFSDPEFWILVSSMVHENRNNVRSWLVQNKMPEDYEKWTPNHKVLFKLRWG